MRTFDFNAIEQPQLAITLRCGMILHLELPTVSHIERLQAEVPKLRETISDGDLGRINKYYEILADLMSCNAEGMRFTADALEQEYRITMCDMVAFYAAYMQFIDEVKSAKN